MQLKLSQFANTNLKNKAVIAACWVYRVTVALHGENVEHSVTEVKVKQLNYCKLLFLSCSSALGYIS